MDQVQQMYILAVTLLIGAFLGMLPELIRKCKLRNEPENPLVKDEKGRQLYIDQSHILMAGLKASTECINCGGNSNDSENVEKLLRPCSMELSVYNGNTKFKHSTGETND